MDYEEEPKLIKEWRDRIYKYNIPLMRGCYSDYCFPIMWDVFKQLENDTSMLRCRLDEEAEYRQPDMDWDNLKQLDREYPPFWNYYYHKGMRKHQIKYNDEDGWDVCIKVNLTTDINGREVNQSYNHICKILKYIENKVYPLKYLKKKRQIKELRDNVYKYNGSIMKIYYDSCFVTTLDMLNELKEKTKKLKIAFDEEAEYRSINWSWENTKSTQKLPYFWNYLQSVRTEVFQFKYNLGWKDWYLPTRDKMNKFSMEPMGLKSDVEKVINYIENKTQGIHYIKSKKKKQIKDEELKKSDIVQIQPKVIRRKTKMFTKLERTI